MRRAGGAGKEQGFPSWVRKARALEHQLPGAACESVLLLTHGRGVQEPAFPRGSRDAHVFPAEPATAFTSLKPN